MAKYLKGNSSTVIEGTEKCKKFAKIVKGFENFFLFIISQDLLEMLEEGRCVYSCTVSCFNDNGKFSSLLMSNLEEFAALILKHRKGTVNILIDDELPKLEDCLHRSSLARQSKLDLQELYTELLMEIFFLKSYVQRNYKHRIKKFCLNDQLNKGVELKLTPNITNTSGLSKNILSYQSVAERGLSYSANSIPHKSFPKKFYM